MVPKYEYWVFLRPGYTEEKPVGVVRALEGTGIFYIITRRGKWEVWPELIAAMILKGDDYGRVAVSREVGEKAAKWVMEQGLNRLQFWRQMIRRFEYRRENTQMGNEINLDDVVAEIGELAQQLRLMDSKLTQIIEILYRVSSRDR